MNREPVSSDRGVPHRGTDDPTALGRVGALDGRALLLVFCVALAMRAGWGTYRLVRADDPNRLEFPDEEQYWLMAQSLAAGDGLRDEFGFRATRMPLHPALLAPFAALDNGVVVAKVVQWVIGSLAAVFTALIASALLNRRAAVIAGLLVALDPFLVFFSSLLLTETTFITCLTLLWWVGARSLSRSEPSHSSGIPWITLGVVGALCVYARESTLGLFVLLVFVLVVARGFRWRSLIGGAGALAIVFVALTPWAFRNWRVAGDWCWLTHRAGISLYDGVGPRATGESDLADIKRMPAVAAMNEVEWNRYFLDESIKAIQSEPGRIVHLAGVKLARMWNPVPNVETYRSGGVRVLAAVWTIPTFGLALAGAVLLPLRSRKGGWRITLFLLLPAMYLSALHSLFIGSVRYRLGAVPMIGVLAAVALVAMIRRAGDADRRGDANRGA